jgi:hypothetical protein
VTAPEDVPEADRLEQAMPAGREARDLHPIPPDAPDADVLEQELPVAEDAETVGIDAERTEPLADEDWASTAPGG